MEYSFSAMGDTSDSRSTQTNTETYAAMQTVKMHVLARNITAMKLLAKKNPVFESVDPYLIQNMTNAWLVDEGRRSNNRCAEETKRATLNNNNNDNNYRTERRKSRFFLQSPHCIANRLQHVRSSGPGAIVCKLRATHRALITCNMSCHVPRGTKGQLSY